MTYGTGELEGAGIWRSLRFSRCGVDGSLHRTREPPIGLNKHLDRKPGETGRGVRDRVGPTRHARETQSASGLARNQPGEAVRSAPPQGPPREKRPSRDGNWLRYPRSWSGSDLTGNSRVKEFIGINRANCSVRISPDSRSLDCGVSLTGARHEFAICSAGLPCAFFGVVRRHGCNQRGNTQGVSTRDTHRLRRAGRGHQGFAGERDDRSGHRHAAARDDGQARRPLRAVREPLQRPAQVSHAARRASARAASVRSSTDEIRASLAACAVAVNHSALIELRRLACFAAPGVIPTARAKAAGPPKRSITSENELGI